MAKHRATPDTARNSLWDEQYSRTARGLTPEESQGKHYAGPPAIPAYAHGANYTPGSLSAQARPRNLSQALDATGWQDGTPAGMAL